MTKSVIARATALFLLLAGAACTNDGQPVATSAPAASAGEPLDLSSLSGKYIKIRTDASGDYSIGQGDVLLRVIGSTVIWDILSDYCIVKGQLWRTAILYSPNQPRSGVRIPCEAGRRRDVEILPADAAYSSTMSMQGNVMELRGELTEHGSRKYYRPTDGSFFFAVKEDSTVRQHLKVRLFANKCEVVDYSVTGDLRKDNGSGQPTFEKRRERAIGCSIMTPTE